MPRHASGCSPPSPSGCPRFLGTGLAGITQVLLAGLSGIALYYFRVAFGAIVVGMVMHGLFDVTTFLSTGS